MKRVNESHLPFVAKSHPGMRGKNNEDRCEVYAFKVGANEDKPAMLAVLSDGIGGHRAGEVAAQIVVERMGDFLLSAETNHDPVDFLRYAVQTISQEIYSQAQSKHQQEGMGATLAAAWIVERRLFIASVGDSRIYLLRGGVAQQLTRDHTWIQEALDKKLLTEAQAKRHPNSHVIRRFLGSAQVPEPDFLLRLKDSESAEESRQNQGMMLQEGDIVLLCSDGLSDLVSAEEIAAHYARIDLESATDELVELANERGGHDNITILAVEVPEKGKAAGPKIPLWILYLIGAVLVVGASAWAIGDYLNQRGQVLPTETPTLGLTLPTQQLSKTPTLRPTMTPIPIVTQAPATKVPAGVISTANMTVSGVTATLRTPQVSIATSSSLTTRTPTP